MPRKSGPPSFPRIKEAAAHYKKFCECIGIDLTQEDTVDTPMRVARMFACEFTQGQHALPFKFTTFAPAGKDLVCVCGIRFVSVCAHHHLPMMGQAHFCYLPKKKMAGLSKIPRYIKWAALRPTVQEGLTRDCLDSMCALLEPHFAAMTITATHTCMACRGVQEHEARMTTTAIFSEDGDIDRFANTRLEFQQAIDLWYKGHGIH